MKRSILIALAALFAFYIALLCFSILVWNSNIPDLIIKNINLITVVFYLFPVMAIGYLGFFTWIRYKNKISMQEFMVYLIIPPSIGYFISSFFTI